MTEKKLTLTNVMGGERFHRIAVEYHRNEEGECKREVVEGEHWLGVSPTGGREGVPHGFEPLGLRRS